MGIALERIDKPSWMSNVENDESDTNGNIVVAVIGAKGGIGKSTVSFFMAATVAGDDQDVALVDLDLPSPNLTKALLLKTDKSFVDFDRFPKDFQVGDLVCTQKMENVHGVHFLPGIKKSFNEMKGNIEINSSLARKMIYNLSNSFSITFFDLGVPSNNLHYEILRFATHVIVVTDESRVGIQASNDFIKDMEKIVRIKHKTKYIINAIEDKKKKQQFNVLINLPILGTILYQPQVKKAIDSMQYEKFLSSTNDYLREIKEITKIFRKNSPEDYLSFYQQNDSKRFVTDEQPTMENLIKEDMKYNSDLEDEEDIPFWKRIFKRKKK